MFLDIHGLTRSAQTAGRVLDFSSGICMNDMFKQQQAKQPWGSCGKNCADSLQDKAEQIEWTININTFVKTEAINKMDINFFKTKNQVFHTGQLKKEDIEQKGLLQLQIHTKTTFQLWVTLPPKILRFSPYLPLPFTITQLISTTTPSVAQCYEKLFK